MQRHSRLLAEHLAVMPGIKLTVVHPHGAAIFPPALGIQEEFVAPIDASRFYLAQLWSYSGRVASVLDRVRPHMILSQGFSVWKDIDRFGARLIVHPHGLEMFQGLTLRDRVLGAPFRFVMRWIVRRAKVCISLGGRLTPILQQCVKGARTEVVVLPNAVDIPAEMMTYPSGTGPLNLLFVGRFAHNKGLDLLISVAERLQQEGRANEVRFKLVGNGPLMASILAKGLPANVEILGNLDDSALDEAYAWSHALVLPTRFEGMPTVVLEAMARGRAILVSDVGATAEQVDVSNGYLLPKGDAVALYKAILAFSAMPTEGRKAMAAASFQRARDQFGWPTIATAFISLFERTMKQLSN